MEHRLTTLVTSLANFTVRIWTGLTRDVLLFIKFEKMVRPAVFFFFFQVLAGVTACMQSA